MTTHYSARKGKRYFYYVCQSAQKRGAAACKGSRVVVATVEGAVVERIRAIGRAPELIEESLQAVEREVERMKPELRKKLDVLEKERARLDDETRNLISALGKGQGDALIHQRLGEIHVAIANAEKEAHEARAELATLDGRVIDPEDLRRAIESFDPVWGELFPAERARILRLLIERVTYDGRTREVAVEFRPGGVRALAGEEKAKLA
jgi:site-specific DNA recombinase